MVPKYIFYIGLLLTLSLLLAAGALHTRSFPQDILSFIIGVSALGAFLVFTHLLRAYLFARRKLQKLETILGALPLGVVKSLKNGDLKYANQYLTHKYPALLKSDAVAQALQDLAGKASGSQPAHDIKYIPHEEKEIALKIMSVAANNENVVHSIIDISHLTQELQDKSALASFLDESPIGFFSLNSTGDFIYCNKTAAGFFDISHGAFNKFNLKDRLKGSVSRFLPPHLLSINRINKGLHEHIFTINETPYKVYQRVLTRDEGPITCSVIVPYEKNNKSLLPGHLYNSLFQDLPTGIVVTDIEGRIKNANPAFLQMIQKPLHSLANTEFSSLITKDSYSAYNRLLHEVSLVEQSTPHPVDVHFKNNKNIQTSLRVKPIYETKEHVGYILQFVDMSQHKRLEMQFVHTQRMQAVGQLAGGVAHDFNNLLTAMIGFCDLLLLRHAPGEQTFTDVMQIKQNAHRAANLVKQLLAFSRQQSLQPKVLNVADTLSDITILLRRLLGANIQLKVRHSREVGFVRVDQGQLEQVIINLAVNARDAMKTGGTLVITTGTCQFDAPHQVGPETMPPGNYVLVEVIDSGDGIPDNIIDRIFEPFFSTKEIGSGTGLGLSMVYGIIRQTGGYIFVESELGKGTSFKIFLPRHTPSKSDTLVQKEEKKAKDLTGTEKILLVEDEDAVRMFSARALKEKGYQVIEAASGEGGLSKCLEHKDISLVVTDVVMPNMDGPTFIGKAREQAPELKVIFISGYTEDSFRSKLSLDENMHFLSKPFNLKDLAAKVKEVLEQ